MNEWWDGLSALLKVLYCIAFPSTLVLLLQTLLSMFGVHHGGAGDNPSDTSGIDFDGHVHTDLCAGVHHFDVGGHHSADSIDGGNPSDFPAMRMFTVQTIVAFLTVSSWSAIALIGSDVPDSISVCVGFVLGLAVMAIVAKMVQIAGRLTENGTLNMKNGIGENATVYIPIPKKGDGIGKITLEIQGQLIEATAVTEGDEVIKTGETVIVTDLQGDTFTVEKK